MISGPRRCRPRWTWRRPPRSCRLRQMLAVTRPGTTHRPRVAVRKHLSRGDGAVMGRVSRVNSMTLPVTMMMMFWDPRISRASLACARWRCCMDGDEEPGLHQGVDDLQLLRQAWRGDVKCSLVDHLGVPLAVQLVDHRAPEFWVRGGRAEMMMGCGLDLHLPVGGKAMRIGADMVSPGYRW